MEDCTVKIVRNVSKGWCDSFTLYFNGVRKGSYNSLRDALKAAHQTNEV